MRARDSLVKRAIRFKLSRLVTLLKRMLLAKKAPTWMTRLIHLIWRLRELTRTTQRRFSMKI